jgi:hypothetical protein
MDGPGLCCRHFSGGPATGGVELCPVRLVVMDGTENSGRSSWQLACSLCGGSPINRLLGQSAGKRQRANVAGFHWAGYFQQ